MKTITLIFRGVELTVYYSVEGTKIYIEDVLHCGKNIHALIADEGDLAEEIAKAEQEQNISAADFAYECARDERLIKNAKALDDFGDMLQLPINLEA